MGSPEDQAQIESYIGMHGQQQAIIEALTLTFLRQADSLASVTVTNSLGYLEKFEKLE